MAVPGNEDYWNILLALTSVPVLICLALWPFIPESPRYLFNKQQDEKAIRGVSLFIWICVARLIWNGIFAELCRLRDAAVKELEREIELFRNVALPDSNDDETPTGSGWNLRTIWAKRSLRWPFICVIVMHIGNQLSGINAVWLLICYALAVVYIDVLFNCFELSGILLFDGYFPVSRPR